MYQHPNTGKVPVKLSARYGNVNAGEIAGYPANIARELVAKGFASFHEPSADEKKAHAAQKPAAK